jgi:hypothetical protein
MNQVLELNGLDGAASKDGLDQHGRHSMGTTAIHAGYKPSVDFVKGAVAPPIYTTTIYERSCQDVIKLSLRIISRP